MKTALILDPDIGFGFWLARGLDQAKYQSFPAKSVPDAAALIGEVQAEVDLLIVNPALSGTAELIESLRQNNGQLRVVALIGDQPQLRAIDARVDLCCRKPDRTDAKRREWIEHVEELLPVSLFGAALESSALLRKCAGALARHAQQSGNQAGAPPRLVSAAVAPWKEWEGRVIDGQFRLERHLGGDGPSAVFLTRCGNGVQQAAAIKLILAESADPEMVLPRWERAAALSHPGLVRLLAMGNCESDGAALLYVVMEHAEENLADVLRQRALTPAEARETLEPVLDALAYIHSHGLVHGRVKPSNILAVADRLKISSDALRAAGERAVRPAARGAYDPPETRDGLISPAGDVWALGITLVEALTQRAPEPKRAQHKPPALPVTIPPLFLDLAKQCLQPDPQRRGTVASLADRLRSAPPAGEPPRRYRRRELLKMWRYAVPAATLGLVLSGILIQPLHRSTARIRPVAAPVTPQAAPVTAQTASPSEPVTPLPAVTPVAVIEAQAPAPPLARKVAEQVLPDVSESARETIHGMLEVRIRARVDSSGAVADAAIDSPGPSHYFANRALAAAQRWKFAPLAGGGAAEDWMLRFDYTNKDTQAHAERFHP